MGTSAQRQRPGRSPSARCRIAASSRSCGTGSTACPCPAPSRSPPSATTPTCVAPATTSEEETDRMLITPTIDKLHALALTGMARALVDQLERADYAALSFEERLGLLVDREMQDRENRRLARYLKAARLRSDAVIEDLSLIHI